MLLSFFLHSFFDLLAFHRFVMNMDISGDCVSDRLNTNLFARHKRNQRQKMKTPNQFYSNVVFSIHNTSRVFCLFWLSHELIVSHIKFALYFTTGVQTHTIVSIFGSFICYRVCVCVSVGAVVVFSLILAFKVYRVRLDNRSLISPRNAHFFHSCSHCHRHFSCSCFVLCIRTASMFLLIFTSSVAHNMKYTLIISKLGITMYLT